MELGQLLKQVRLEKGLSQRQVCGDVITRNMLSQIENGSAKPSMDTLRYLAGALGKPVGYFLQEESPVAAARQAFSAQEYKTALELLGQGDASAEGLYLEALCSIALAREALDQNKLPYACELLERAAVVGAQTPYYTSDTERGRLLLCCQADSEHTAEYVKQLPSVTPELIARSKAAPPDMQLKWLAAVDTAESALQKGQAFMKMGDYENAAKWFHQAEIAFPRPAAEGLEVCYRELKDFEKAYYYACKCR